MVTLNLLNEKNKQNKQNKTNKTYIYTNAYKSYVEKLQIYIYIYILKQNDVTNIFFLLSFSASSHDQHVESDLP